MKKIIVGGVVMGLLLAGLAGTGRAAAQGPDFDPDAYTVSIAGPGAADIAVFGGPGDNFDYAAMSATWNSLGDSDPDAYTVPIETSAAADMSVSSGSASQIIWSYDQDTDTWIQNVINDSNVAPDAPLFWVAPYES